MKQKFITQSIALAVTALLLGVAAGATGVMASTPAKAEWLLDVYVTGPDGQTATGVFQLRVAGSAVPPNVQGEATVAAGQCNKALLACAEVLLGHMDGMFYLGERSPLRRLDGSVFYMDAPGVYGLLAAGRGNGASLAVRLAVTAGAAAPLPPGMGRTAEPGDIAGYLCDTDATLLSIAEQRVPLAGPDEEEPAEEDEPEPEPEPEPKPEPVEKPERAEAPQPTDAPERTEAPDPTDAPERAEAPDPTDAPERAEVPESADVPERAEESGPADAPEPDETPAPIETEPTAYKVTYLDTEDLLFWAAMVPQGETIPQPNDEPLLPDGHAFLYWTEDAPQDIPQGEEAEPFDFTVGIDRPITLRPCAAPAQSVATQAPQENLAPPEPEPFAPEADIAISYEGAFHLGTTVTLTATLSNMPEGRPYSVQWQNDATGEFLDVPGATEPVHQFVSDAANTGCTWRILVQLIDVPGEPDEPDVSDAPDGPNGPDAPGEPETPDMPEPAGD
ncbi:MAG: hypothetical protein LBU67_09380 [Oscillospiraceae bacterium]|jgi:hypothetical protein|nr:hypothetical protein [Oscillospiraceae bacterium]